jgi:hypothetical protein
MKAQSSNFKAQHKSQAPNSKKELSDSRRFGALSLELLLSFELGALSFPA